MENDVSSITLSNHIKCHIIIKKENKTCHKKVLHQQCCQRLLFRAGYTVPLLLLLLIYLFIIYKIKAELIVKLAHVNFRNHKFFHVNLFAYVAHSSHFTICYTLFMS